MCISPILMERINHILNFPTLTKAIVNDPELMTAPGSAKVVDEKVKQPVNVLPAEALAFLTRINDCSDFKDLDIDKQFRKLANVNKDFRRAIYHKLRSRYGSQLEGQLDKNLRYSTLKILCSNLF